MTWKRIVLIAGLTVGGTVLFMICREEPVRLSGRIVGRTTLMYSEGRILELTNHTRKNYWIESITGEARQYGQWMWQNEIGDHPFDGVGGIPPHSQKRIKVPLPTGGKRARFVVAYTVDRTKGLVHWIYSKLDRHPPQGRVFRLEVGLEEDMDLATLATNELAYVVPDGWRLYQPTNPAPAGSTSRPKLALRNVRLLTSQDEIAARTTAEDLSMFVKAAVQTANDCLSISNEAFRLLVQFTCAPEKHDVTFAYDGPAKQEVLQKIYDDWNRMPKLKVKQGEITFQMELEVPHQMETQKNTWLLETQKNTSLQ